MTDCEFLASCHLFAVSSSSVLFIPGAVTGFPKYVVTFNPNPNENFDRCD